MKDNAGLTSSTTLTVTIHGANDASVAVADTNTISKLANPSIQPISIYVATHATNSSISIWDPTTGAISGTKTATLPAGSAGGGLSDMAVDANKNFWVIEENISFTASYLYKFDQNMVSIGSQIQVKLNGSSVAGLTALGFDTAGNMYAASERGTNDNLYKIDPTTGSATVLANIAGGSSGDIAYFNGKLYITEDSTSANGGKALIQVYDIATGTINKFMDLPNSGFYGIAFDQTGTMWLTDSNDAGTDTIYKVDMSAATPTLINTGKTVQDGSTDIYGAGSYLGNSPLTVPNNPTDGGNVLTGSNYHYTYTQDSYGNTTAKSAPIAGTSSTADSDVDSGQTINVTDVSSVNIGSGNTTLTGFGNTMVKGSDGVMHINGQYGWLDIDTNGAYTYTLDQSRADTQGLTGTATDTFNYTIADNGSPSLTSSSTLTINVTGLSTNINPSIWDDTYTISTDTFSSWDGGFGTDTVKIANQFGSLNIGSTELAKLTNVERLDMNTSTTAQNAGSVQNLTIKYSDVLSMNATGKTLFVDGDANDSVTLKNSSLTKTGTYTDSTGHLYNTYTGSGATLYLDTDITNIL